MVDMATIEIGLRDVTEPNAAADLAPIRATAVPRPGDTIHREGRGYAVERITWGTVDGLVFRPCAHVARQPKELSAVEETAALREAVAEADVLRRQLKWLVPHLRTVFGNAADDVIRSLEKAEVAQSKLSQLLGEK